MGQDCNLRDSAVGEESARQAGETRRAEHEAAANAVIGGIAGSGVVGRTRA